MEKALQTGQIEISVKGKPVLVNAVYVNGREIIVTGGLIRMASIKGEGWLEGGMVEDPGALISTLKEGKANADIFTFGQMVPHSGPKYDYYMEWDNFAVLPVTTFEHWWTKQLNDKTRNMVRRAQKKGVEVRVTAFDNAFIQGMSQIYNETPIRQGRAFWHTGKTSRQLGRKIRATLRGVNSSEPIAAMN